jgi:hypothetical protein
MLEGIDILDELLGNNSIENYTVSAEKDKLSLEFTDGKHVIVSISRSDDGLNSTLSFSQNIVEGAL